MAIEAGTISGEVLNELQPSPLTWSEQVYKGKVPTAEQFGLTETAFVNLNGAFAASYDNLVGGSLSPEGAQNFAGRVARLELAVRGFCESAGVDTEEATVDILIGLREKYIDEWEAASAVVRAQVEAAGETFDPTSQSAINEIKRICKEWWGKWQLTLSPDQHAILAQGRQLYEEALEDGREPDDAVALAKAGLEEDELEVVYPYFTQSARVRYLDLSRHFDVKPNLQGIVRSSAAFEGMTRQHIRESTQQFTSEVGEVIELRRMFSIKPGDEPGGPAKLVLGFTDMTQFKAHIQKELATGDMSEEEFARYNDLTSLGELYAYIEAHLAYECIDVLVASGGILHRIPANIEVAQAEALADRDVYRDIVVPTMQRVLGPNVRINPTQAATVAKVARDELPEIPFEDAVAHVAPLVASVIGLANTSNIPY